MPGARGKRGQPGRSNARLGTEQAQPAAPGLGRLVWIRLPALVLLVGSIWILHRFFHDERFTVNEVVIEGTRLLPAAQVEAVLGLEQRCTFRVNPSLVADELRAAFPMVAQATVHSQLPDKVTIQVRERDGVMLWESSGGTWWVDVQGSVLGAVQDPLGLLVVHDVDAVAPSPSGRISGVPWELAWELAQALPAIRALDYTRDQGLVLYVTPAQWPVYLGHSGDARVKTALMMALARQLTDSNARVAYIDLRNERRPVFKRQ